MISWREIDSVHESGMSYRSHGVQRRAASISFTFRSGQLFWGESATVVAGKLQLMRSEVPVPTDGSDH